MVLFIFTGVLGNFGVFDIVYVIVDDIVFALS